MGLHWVPKTRAETTSEEALAGFFKALGHPARIRILRLLMEREGCLCGDVVEALPLAQSTVSQHLKILKEAGLILGEVDGPRRCYTVDRSAIQRLRRHVRNL